MRNRTRTLATGFATAALGADASLGVFSVVGEPFGTINDIGIGLSGFLAAGFVAAATDADDGGIRALALTGAAVSAAGSALVVTHTTGWLLAGFVSGLGFGLIGPGVARASARLAQRREIDSRLESTGRVMGWLMATGVTAAVPVVLRIDDAAAAPGWSWLTFLGIGVGLIAAPLWAIAVVRSARAR